jgi:hypothetical protein
VDPPSFLFAPVVVVENRVLGCSRDFLPAQLPHRKFMKKQILPWIVGSGVPVTHNLCDSNSKHPP